MVPKYIGFDIDKKKTVACVVQEGQKNRYQTLRTELAEMHQYLREQGEDGSPLHLTFEISGEAGYRYDALRPYVETLTVSNPSKMTWIFRTSRKNDRIDARQQAVLLSIREVPKVHIPGLEVRQWRRTIQHRRLLVGRSTALKNQIRALLKAHNVTPPERGSWWKRVNRHWMEQMARDWSEVCDESGQYRRLGHISKEGPSVVRWLLVESAWRVIARSPAMRAFYERVHGGQTDRRKVAVVAVARKLLCIMRAMLQTGELFNASLVGTMA